VKEGMEFYANWRANNSLSTYLKNEKVVGIQEIDTRRLTRHLRNHGAQMGIISTEDLDVGSLLAKVKAAPSISSQDLVARVTTPTVYHWRERVWRWPEGQENVIGDGALPYKVVAYDFGVKYNILRLLVEAGCDVTVVPATTPRCKEKPPRSCPATWSRAVLARTGP